MYTIFLLLSIFIPFLGSTLIWLLKGRTRNGLAVLMTFSSLVLTCFLIPPIQNGLTIEIDIRVFDAGFFSLSFIGDGPGLVFALIFSLIGTVVVIYSFEYMVKSKNLTEFYSMTTLMVGSLMGIAFSRNLLLMYIFWEMATLATWRLVGFYRGREEIAVANKTFLMIFAGSSFMLLGFIMIYSDAHTFDLVALRSRMISHTALFFIFIGIITKAAILPVHNWLPDAHTVAPSPMSALLSGIVVKIGILAFMRIFCWTFHVSWDWILMLGIISSIVAASAALLQTDMKRIIAYSTVSQLGYMLLGFALLSEMGLAAGLLYFVVHAIGKAGLFLCAGIVEQKCGERDITKLGGLMKVLPVTGTAFALCALTIIGMPPFGGFFGKLMVINAIVEKGNVWIAGLAVFAAILTMLYFIRLYSAVFLGNPRFTGVKEGSKVMVGCALFLGVVSLGIGLFIKQVLVFINMGVLNVIK